MSPPIRDGSGSSIGNIRLGDGSEISEVRTGAGDVLFSGNAIPDSEINHWPLDEGSGSTAFDTVGSEDGTINGASWTTDAKTGGYALDFQGGDEVELYNFDTAQSFTMTAWVKVRDFATGQYDAGGVFYEQTYGLRVDGGGEIRFRYEDRNGNNNIVASTGHSTGEWIFIAGGFDNESDEISIWTTESEDDSTTVAGPQGDGEFVSGPFHLGHNINQDIPYDGLIDDPRLFLEAPNQDLVSAVYNETA